MLDIAKNSSCLHVFSTTPGCHLPVRDCEVDAVLQAPVPDPPEGGVVVIELLHGRHLDHDLQPLPPLY